MGKGAPLCTRMLACRAHLRACSRAHPRLHPRAPTPRLRRTSLPPPSPTPAHPLTAYSRADEPPPAAAPPPPPAPQLRHFKISTSGAADAVLLVRAEAPLTAIYVRRGATPHPASGAYDAAAQLALTPRWGCDSVTCEARSHFSLTASGCAPDEPGVWHVAIELGTRAEAEAAADAQLAVTGRPLAVVPARFYLSMALLPAEPEFFSVHTPPPSPPPPQLPPLPPPPPMESLEDIAKYGGGGGERGSGDVGGGDGAAGGAQVVAASAESAYVDGFVCCGALRHYVLVGVEATLAPSITLELTHGTMRAVYLQPARCAASSSGVVEAGGADSADCGAANTPDCQASPPPFAAPALALALALAPSPPRCACVPARVRACVRGTYCPLTAPAPLLTACVLTALTALRFCCMQLEWLTTFNPFAEQRFFQAGHSKY